MHKGLPRSREGVPDWGVLDVMGYCHTLLVPEHKAEVCNYLGSSESSTGFTPIFLAYVI